MSQPAKAVPKQMMTRAKNATQHPGHILTGGEDHIKRRTKSQKAADDQCEEEEKQASEMATGQAAICADVLKPPHPHPHPIKKAVKAMETSKLTVAEDKAVGANGKDGKAGEEYEEEEEV
ncbi:hypothetical protein F4604DRAFT_1679790 [Suillus subluteus]|nr:hypothetical protein F4604DRAFT_1679790 [Suillus subluteus]